MRGPPADSIRIRRLRRACQRRSTCVFRAVWLAPALALAALGLVSLLLPSNVHAHTENSEGYSRISLEGDILQYDLRLDYFELGRVVDLGAQPGAPRGELATALRSSEAGIARYLDSRLMVFVDGVRCESGVVGTAVEEISDREYARIWIEFGCPGSRDGAYQIDYSIFFDDNDPLHRNIASYDFNAGQGQHIFTADERELKAGEGAPLGTIARFVQLGFRHILAGYDHVLFVIALLLGVRRLADGLKVASVFTLAHSVTLVLTALGWVNVPAVVVEPLIALSIAYVAVENLFGTTLKSGLPVIFGFGLLHGIGFAGTLRLTGDVSPAMLLSLFSFNIGIELGQALIILALFPVLVFARRFEWSSAVQAVSTGAIGMVGLVWFFERLTA